MTLTSTISDVVAEHILHVLVTGGAGYIGSHAALFLLENGYRVTALDNLSRGNVGAIHVLQQVAIPGRFNFIKTDLSNLEDLHSVFSKNTFDVVMHFAGFAYVGESMEEPLMYFQQNTGNVVNLLDAMRVHNVNKFIYSSTCATYGDHDEMPITEETVQVPVNPYGRSKKLAEEIIKDYSDSNPQFSAAILRYFNVIGSDPQGRLGESPLPQYRKFGRITGACIDATLGRCDSIKIFGSNFPTHDGTCVRDYVHVSDLVDAHLAALKQLRPGAVQIFNVGTGKGVSVREFIAAWIKVTGKQVKVEVHKEKRPGDYSEVYCNPSKIEEELKWKAKFTNLEDSLATAWNWHKAHPNGYAVTDEISNGKQNYDEARQNL
ncbi:hypothetical protein BDL97_16G075200 [Sphagnum fallax]|nr:hypothetical protein BDL97_16G075200 [Sphagnum fallax]KAH8938299.1 hypothetical protein BDL97_16G075200 [Sphagnum fallax]